MKDGNSDKMLRIGNGYDVHVLTEGRRLVLGGVEMLKTREKPTTDFVFDFSRNMEGQKRQISSWQKVKNTKNLWEGKKKGGKILSPMINEDRYTL